MNVFVVHLHIHYKVSSFQKFSVQIIKFFSATKTHSEAVDSAKNAEELRSTLESALQQSNSTNEQLRAKVCSVPLMSTASDVLVH